MLVAHALSPSIRQYKTWAGSTINSSSKRHTVRGARAISICSAALEYIVFMWYLRTSKYQLLGLPLFPVTASPCSGRRKYPLDQVIRDFYINSWRERHIDSDLTNSTVARLSVRGACLIFAPLRRTSSMNATKRVQDCTVTRKRALDWAPATLVPCWMTTPKMPWGKGPHAIGKTRPRPPLHSGLVRPWFAMMIYM